MVFYLSRASNNGKAFITWKNKIFVFKPNFRGEFLRICSYDKREAEHCDLLEAKSCGKKKNRKK